MIVHPRLSNGRRFTADELVELRVEPSTVGHKVVAKLKDGTVDMIRNSTCTTALGAQGKLAYLEMVLGINQPEGAKKTDEKD